MRILTLKLTDVHAQARISKFLVYLQEKALCTCFLADGIVISPSNGFFFSTLHLFVFQSVKIEVRKSIFNI